MNPERPQCILDRPLNLPRKVVTPVDRLDILTVDLLDTLRPLVTEFEELSRELERGLGWHYLLDLSWSAHHLRDVLPGATVLDAGAGLGLIQWHLARRGVNVISVDRGPRQLPGERIRRGFRVRGLRPGDSPLRPIGFRDLLPPRDPRRWKEWPSKLARSLQRQGASRERAPGTVTFHTADLANLAALPDGSVDEIVSISALEHNTADELAHIVDELLRVVRPGGRIVATVGAASSADWFHEPSHGWCFTERTLRRVFQLDSSTRSNFDEFDRWFAELRGCRELEEKLGGTIARRASTGCPAADGTPSTRSPE